MLKIRFIAPSFILAFSGLLLSPCFGDDSAQPTEIDLTTVAPTPPSLTESEPSTTDQNQAPIVQVTPNGSGSLLTSDDGHFSITIPKGFSEVEVETQKVDTEVGPINTINYSASSEHSTYIVGSSTYPKEILSAIKGKEQDIFDGAQEGLLMHMQGKVVEKKDLSIDGNKTRVVDFTAIVDNQTLFGTLQLVLADPRLYHMLYITNQKDELSSEGAKDFFDSFKIKP